MHAADLASKAGDIRLLGIIEHNRGVLMNMRGKYPAAEVRYASSLRSFERVGDAQSVSSVLNNVGILYTKLGHYQRAVETLGRGLDIARARNDAVNESILTLTLAEAWVGCREARSARDACALALELARDRGDISRWRSAEVQSQDRARARRIRPSNPALLHRNSRGEVLEDRLSPAEMLRELGETSKALGKAADARLAGERRPSPSRVSMRGTRPRISACWRPSRPKERSRPTGGGQTRPRDDEVSPSPETLKNG